MSRLIKDIKDSTHRSIPDGGGGGGGGGGGSPYSYPTATTTGPAASGVVVGSPVAASGASPSSGAQSGGANSPMSGNRIVKTWRVMGDRTRSKTKDILKRWQTMNNGQTSEDSLAGLDDCSDMSGSTESDRGHRQKKGTWSVHVWMDSQSWIQLTPRRRTYFRANDRLGSNASPRSSSASSSFRGSSEPSARLLRHATWVRRPFEDDDDMQPPEGKMHLSDFQVEKFTYYFTDVFDHNKDRVITIEDIHALNERMRHYAGWSEDNEYYLTMKEIHADFFECLLEHVGKIEPEYGFEFDVDRIPDRVQMYQWLNMWGNLTHGARAMLDFPIWLQILPKILFKVINRKDNGIISFDELRSFYAHFIKLPEVQLDTVSEEAYRALTSSGDFPITEGVYLMAFANFLLGKTPHGPGKYIFGGFKDSDVGFFQVDYSCLLEPTED